MNLEYVWWILALILAGGGVLAFLAFGRVPEIEDDDETAEAPPDAAPAAQALSDAANSDSVRSGPAG
jgi:hypothetical protein